MAQRNKELIHPERINPQSCLRLALYGISLERGTELCSLAHFERLERPTKNNQL